MQAKEAENGGARSVKMVQSECGVDALCRGYSEEAPPGTWIIDLSMYHTCMVKSGECPCVVFSVFIDLGNKSRSSLASSVWRRHCWACMQVTQEVNYWP